MGKGFLEEDANCSQVPSLRGTSTTTEVGLGCIIIAVGRGPTSAPAMVALANLEHHVRGDLGLRPTLGVGRPPLGQIEPTVQEDVSRGARVGQHRRDLAVLDLAGRSTLLALNPDRAGAPLEDAGLIDDPDALRIAKRLAHEVLQDVASRLHVPVRAVEQPLSPIGCGIADRFGYLPAVLAFDGGEQSAQILRPPGANGL
jgi:hypothetical protein